MSDSNTGTFKFGSYSMSTEEEEEKVCFLNFTAGTGIYRKSVLPWSAGFLVHDVVNVLGK